MEEEEVREALRRLRYLTISGGDLDPAGLSRLRSLAEGVAIYKTYGQTETFRSGMLMPEEFETRPASVGRPPRGVRVSVIDETGAPVAPGTIGQIVHTGVGTMLGYLGDREGTDRKLAPSPDDSTARMVLTGDRGYVDEAGYLFLKGRADRMLKVRGNRVYPEEIEAELRQHPDVDEAVVLLLDGRLAAGVVSRAETLDLLGLRAHLAGRLMAFMVPEAIVPCTPFPRTATGKIDLTAAAALVRRSVEA
jgi:acyl-coenzyme A synthetase/AMP-(fatty) acid ligase